MNLERNITYMAVLLMAAILLAYALGLQNRVHFVGFGKQTTVTAANSPIVAAAASQGEVADLQALAQYQAVLATFPATPTRTASVKAKPVEQVADLQALAAYQASQSAFPATTSAATPFRPNGVEQIANLQELARYQEEYATYTMVTIPR
jgi:hypothetical protein